MKFGAPVSIATLFLFVLVATASLGLPIALVVAMTTISPFVVIWMVIKVLREKRESEKTFKDYFYEDMEEKRVESREMY